MADNTTLNTGTGGDVIATDDIGGVKYQRVKATYGVDGSATDVSTTNPLPVAGVAASASGTIGALNANVQVTLNGATSVGYYITTTLTGTLKGQYSYDGTNWLDGSIQTSTVATSTSQPISNAVQSGVLYVQPGAVYARLICSAYTSGTSTATVTANNATPIVRVGDGSFGSAGAAAVKAAGAGVSGSDAALVVAVSPNTGVKIFDGTNTMAVKAASTAASATDPAAVVSISPNSGILIDNAAFTDGTTRLLMPGYILDDVAGTALTENDAAAARIDSKRAQVMVIEGATRATQADVSSAKGLFVGGDTASGSADVGNPLKIGFKATTTTPTAVTTGQRVNAAADVYGRQLVSHIDAGMQVWKSFNATTTQTGANIWVPGSGKKIVLTHLQIGTYGTTAARCIIWFAVTATTAYTEGTHQVAFKGSFAPGTSAKPGAILALPTPIYCTTADGCLKITTDAAMSVDVIAYGYEV